MGKRVPLEVPAGKNNMVVVLWAKNICQINSLEQAGHVTSDRHLIVYMEVNIKFIVCMCNLIVLQHNLLHLKA